MNPLCSYSRKKKFTISSCFIVIQTLTSHQHKPASPETRVAHPFSKQLKFLPLKKFRYSRHAVLYEIQVNEVVIQHANPWPVLNPGQFSLT